MDRRVRMLGLVAWLAAACTPSVNLEQERQNLLDVDREWSKTTKDLDRFMSYFAPEGSIYPPGMPIVTGASAIRKTFGEMTSSPGFSLQWTPAKAEVSESGDFGRTSGTYESTMGGVTDRGKYLTVWKKQADGSWKVTDDMFNSDQSGPPPAQHLTATPRDLKWMDAPPTLPPGSRLAVVAGDPGKPGAFALRLQMPAGYRVPPHWHPTDENVTILSGTLGVGMGETFDQAALKDLPAGGYIVMPATMRHFVMARSAVTLQLNGMGPFVINYVNPADDPSAK